MLEVREELCTGCGLCARVCPSTAIGVRLGNAEIDTERCTDCQACSTVCPTYAIQPVYASNVEHLRRRLASLSQKVKWVSGKLNGLASKHLGYQ